MTMMGGYVLGDKRSWNDIVEELIDLGILAEGIQEDTYTRYPVLKPELLPQGFGADYEQFGEIRND
jgi:hypothetical protein